MLISCCLFILMVLYGLHQNVRMSLTQWAARNMVGLYPLHASTHLLDCSSKKKKFHLFLRIFHLHNSNKNYDERNGNLRTIVLGWASFCRHAVLCCSSLEWWNYFHHNLLGRRGSLTGQIDVTGVYYEGWKLWMTVDWDLAHHDFTKWDLGNLKMAFTLGNWGHSKQRLAKRWLAKLL